MFTREQDEVYSITYTTTLSSSTAPCPQLTQISVALVQLMGFTNGIWGSGQSCLLQQLRKFGLLFSATPVGVNSLLCLCDCKQAPCRSGSPSCIDWVYVPSSEDATWELPWLQAAAQVWPTGDPLANQYQILKIRLQERLWHTYSVQ